MYMGKNKGSMKRTNGDISFKNFCPYFALTMKQSQCILKDAQGFQNMSNAFFLEWDFLNLVINKDRVFWSTHFQIDTHLS